MESSKIYAYLFLCMLFISSATPILGCGYCGKPKKQKPSRKPKTTPIVKPPVTLPPIVVPPITVPPVIVPPVITPPSLKPPVSLPIPPILNPPVILPPVLNPPTTPAKGGNSPCPPPKSPAQATCPIDTLKLGSCVDLLGGLIHIGVGDPAANQCCPVLQGLVEVEAAACLCTTLKLKLLNLNIYVPLALQLLVACGKSPPPGYTCSL
ncbi:hypothetical protein LR48_Vigan01g255200 [Vigna angularis]|uniref:Proline-rich protein n=2 Tax=Phaseolus angularis TaxID=3914 RepID=A0A0L9TR89_PHAAN|nr:36.4 kDa proline-rich protein [Vigna angularis]KAG2407976.1 proline-rich protein [Vigna angularis]KOM32996.1 hypothetical protein LR48_Vigan01g255200 [Vigna angularis]BAT76309.1 hypothetical protein VIGAN_01429000 [Vigna angularis var. angularis]